MNSALKARKLSDRFFVGLALLFMACLMLSSVSKDSVTADEAFYLPTGYYYLTQQRADMGYEHPPLVRDLAALPLLFLDLKPATTFITPEIMKNPETALWIFGDDFMYGQTRSPDTMLWYSRCMMIGLTLAFGVCLFLWSRKLYGARTARLTLLLFVLSPFFLAHGRYLTMDVPSAFGCLAVLYAFYRYLQRHTRRAAALAGLVLGLALLVKFPLSSLVPFLVLLHALWTWAHRGSVRAALLNLAVLFAVAAGVVYAVYVFHLWNYPKADQIAEMEKNLQLSRGYAQARLAWLSKLAQIDVLRPFAHYLYGMGWQVSRTGAFGYFMGEGSYTSWGWFYPFGYLVKTPIAFHLLLLLALWKRVANLRKPESLRTFVREKFWPVLSALWIFYYLYVLIFVNSGNTGSRYLLSVLPFLFMGIAHVLATHWGDKRLRIAVLALLAAQAASVLRVHPSYLAYFNFIAGGPENGSEYLVDTDADWGQDKRRLAEWVQAQGIPEIQVANGVTYKSVGFNSEQTFYFHAKDFQYYLRDRYRPYVLGTQPKGWLAVPVQVLRWGQTSPAERLGWYSQSYGWLRSHRPVAKIGYSIWVYHLD